jgi:hypothetical protein
LPQSEGGSVSKLLKLSNLYDIQVKHGTYTQMKSSGSLRYLDDPLLLSYLQEYYEIQVPRAVKWSEGSAGFFTDYMRTSFSNNINSSENDEVVQQQINIMQNYYTYLFVLARQLYRPANRQAEKLIRLLEKEYELDHQSNF